MRRRVLLIAAGAAAVVNLALGLAMSREPDRLGDFTLVQHWASTWWSGANPYGPDSIANYPPHALVALSPLAMSPAVALPIWVGINVALAVSIAAMGPRRRGIATVWMWMTLALAPFRTLNQFSLAAFAPALAGVLASRRRPILAGVAIGLGLIKPHIGGPALLWAVAARRWRTAGVAIAVPLALSAIYLTRAGTGAAALIRDYSAALLRNQNRPDLIRGETNIQPLFDALGASPVATQAGIAAALLLFLPIVWRRSDPSERDLRFFAAASLVSLLAFRHLSYNLLLAIPALTWMVTHGDRGLRIAGGVAFMALAASPSTLWRYVLEPAGAGPIVGAVFLHAYRVVLLALFAVLVLAKGDASGRRPSFPRQSSAPPSRPGLSRARWRANHDR